jgi:UDP-glucuronate 4-epimerase
VETRLRYFITGTAGFIGFHLARRLLEQGHSVTGYDGLTPYYDVELKARRHAILSEFRAFVPVIGMLEDSKLLSSTIQRSEPDIIVHLAAQAGVRYSLENPGAYINSNLIGSWNLLEASVLAKPKHLLLASSSSIYGANDQVPFLETDRADEPLTIYAATKKSMELMAHSYSHLHKIPTTAFRFFTVYGPWGRPDMALFKFVDAIFNSREIEIYGGGRITRDFTYIDDLIEAVVLLADVIPSEANRVTTDNVVDTLSRQAPFRTVNIGDGSPIDINRFVDIIEASVGRKAIKKLLPMQKGDVPQTYASPELLSALTGFRPTVGVETGIPRFVSWYQEEMMGMVSS